MKKKTALKKKLLAFNWKMNPKSIGEAKALFVGVKKIHKKAQHSVALVCPPYPYIAELRKLSTQEGLSLGAQDVFEEKEGAHTGEVSLSMLKSMGVAHVIVGHSERRASGEDDAMVNKKLLTTVGGGVHALLCVGEEERDTQGKYFNVVETQLRTALEGMPTARVKYLTIAYEPVWAIGTGDHAEPADVEEMRLFIKKVLVDIFGRAKGANVSVLYGGSVNGKNITPFLEGTGCDGFLIGGASLKEKEVRSMCEAVELYGEKA